MPFWCLPAEKSTDFIQERLKMDRQFYPFQVFNRSQSDVNINLQNSQLHTKAASLRPIFYCRYIKSSSHQSSCLVRFSGHDGRKNGQTSPSCGQQCNSNINVHFLCFYVGCGIRNFSGPTGIISSPNFPMAYDNYLDCYNYVRVASGHTVIITFLAFDTEARRDLVTVRISTTNIWYLLHVHCTHDHVQESVYLSETIYGR